MFSYVLFPLCVYIPFFLLKSLCCNRKVQCEYEFTLNTDIDDWDTFILQFNRRNNPYKVVDMMRLIDKFANKGLIDYNEVYITVDSIDIMIKNDLDGSGLSVNEILSEKMIEFNNYDDRPELVMRTDKIVEEDINENREEIVELSNDKDKDV